MAAGQQVEKRNGRGGGNVEGVDPSTAHRDLDAPFRQAKEVAADTQSFNSHNDARPVAWSRGLIDRRRARRVLDGYERGKRIERRARFDEGQVAIVARVPMSMEASRVPE
jgi:hypothetical protein